MNPFAQDEGKEFVDKTKLNVLLKLFKQIGFCKNKRTSDHMFVLKTLIKKYTQNNPSPFFMFY
jgi:hypothetical protein